MDTPLNDFNLAQLKTLPFAQLPPEVADVNGNHCIAESIISAGWQYTSEGYSYDGQVRVYGTVDSLREGVVGSSFSRYQYLSALPEGGYLMYIQLSLAVKDSE